jgi:hypothetical protein
MPNTLTSLTSDPVCVCTAPRSFISVPRDLGSLNCGAFCAGVVRGVLDAAGFPAVVSAYAAPVEGQGLRTNVLMKFAPEVLAREGRLG